MKLEELHMLSTSILGNGTLTVPPKNAIESGSMVLRVDWHLKGEHFHFKRKYSLDRPLPSVDRFIKEANKAWEIKNDCNN